MVSEVGEGHDEVYKIKGVAQFRGSQPRGVGPSKESQDKTEGS